jgi:predicted nucleotidyltransferase
MKENVHKKSYETLSQWVYRRKIIAFFSHWLFQGILYADKTEKAFRIFIDACLILFFFLVLSNFISYQISIIFSLIIGHTLNAIFNGQMLSVIHGSSQPRNLQDLTGYAILLKKRISKEKSIHAAAIYGSFCRGETTESSDLDIRIIRKRGMINGLRSCSFVLIERSRALFNKFPLDIYVLDNTKHLKMKIREDETPVVLYDSEGVLKNLYKKVNYLENSLQ